MESVGNPGSLALGVHPIRRRYQFLSALCTPLSFYWIMASRLVTGDGEMALRWTQMACVMLTFATIYLGCLSGARATGEAGGVRRVDTLPAEPHAAHDRQVDRAAQPLRAPRDAHADGDRPGSSRRGNWRTSTLPWPRSASASLTLEYAAVLAMALAGCLAFSPRALTAERRRRDVLRIVMRAGLLFLLIFCLAWPARILKLSVIKNYLFFIYFTMYRSRAYGSDPVWQVWLGHFLASPVEYALALVGVVWVGARLLRGRVERWSLPFLAYTVLMAGTTLRNRYDQPPVRLVTRASAARVGRPRRRAHRRTVDDSANGRRRGGANGRSGELLLEPTSRRPREIDISG